jgi:hypothetical protein
VRKKKGPFFGWYPADWIDLFGTREYDYIRSSDVADKNGREIFVGDLISIGDGPPSEVVEKLDRVGIMMGGDFEELTEDWSMLYEIVGQAGIIS